MAVKRQYMVGFTQLDARIDENSKNIYLIMSVNTCIHVCWYMYACVPVCAKTVPPGKNVYTL